MPFVSGINTIPMSAEQIEAAARRREEEQSRVAALKDMLITIERRMAADRAAMAAAVGVADLDESLVIAARMAALEAVGKEASATLARTGQHGPVLPPGMSRW